MFDKRGSGLSDPVRQVPTLEARMDDVRAVLDAAGAGPTVLWAGHEGTRLAILFAATYPARTRALVLYDPTARGLWAKDYPWAPTQDAPRRVSRARRPGAGEVLVSSTVRDLVAGSGLEFHEHGTHELKGVPGEWRLFALSNA